MNRCPFIILLMKNIKDCRIVYMGTPEMSAKILESMIQDGFNIVALIAQEDKPVGRKGILMDVPTKVVAKAHNIPVYQPHKIRLDYEFVKELKPDLILTMAYGQIIPQGLLDLPTLGCLNLHGSILPKYRGAAPIQRAILNGETKTGVTLMEMVDKMDAGRMYAVEECDILPEDNYTSLCDKIVSCCIKLVKDQLPKYVSGELEGVVQDEPSATFADKIKPEDEKLDLSTSCTEFINKVRALSEVPGAFVLVDYKKLKIFKVRKISESVSYATGELQISKTPILQLKDGQIELLEVQLEGKKKMDGRSFANGNHQLSSTIVK